MYRVFFFMWLFGSIGWILFQLYHRWEALTTKSHNWEEAFEYGRNLYLYCRFPEVFQCNREWYDGLIVLPNEPALLQDFGHIAVFVIYPAIGFVAAMLLAFMLSLVFGRR